MNRIAKAVLLPIALPLRARFTAGEKMGGALRAAEEVRASGATPMLNYLGEHFQNIADVEEQCAMYRTLIEHLEPGDRVVVKPSQIGYDMPGYGMLRAREHLADFLAAAHDKNILVEIDMEDASRAQASVSLALAFNSRFRPPTRVAIAARMNDSENYAKILSHMGVPIRLVKGAYNDDPRHAFRAKEHIAAQYAHLVNLLFHDGTDPAFATHDRAIIEYVCSRAEQFGLQKRSYEFQFLKGFRPKMQEELVAQGYRVAVYIPFGPLWFEYGMRRWKFFRRNPKDLLAAIFG